MLVRCCSRSRMVLSRLAFLPGWRIGALRRLGCPAGRPGPGLEGFGALARRSASWSMGWYRWSGRERCYLRSTGVREVWWWPCPGEERGVHAGIVSAVSSLPSLSYVAWTRKLGGVVFGQFGGYGSVTWPGRELNPYLHIVLPSGRRPAGLAMPYFRPRVLHKLARVRAPCAPCLYRCGPEAIIESLLWALRPAITGIPPV